MTLEKLYQEFLLSSGICTDTRKEVGNALFFALKGDNFDGNRFVGDALDRGCRLAITESKDMKGRDRVLYVSSSLELLQELAFYHRKVLSPRVIAITGSNGKTTTKELLAALLSKQYNVLATKGNLNNHIGVPLTLLSMKDEEVAIIEMGANHSGEIKRLAEIADPDFGVITNVGKAHLEGFGSLEGVLEAKSELYAYLAGNDGIAVIDGSDPLLLRRAGETGVSQLVVGKKEIIPVDADIYTQSPFLSLNLQVDGSGYTLDTRLVGAYNLQNVRLAVAVGYVFDVPVEDMIEAIGDYQPENQRSQFLKGERNQLILDAYNANPTSMREAIGALLQYAEPPLMLILGDMAEMGSASLEEHQDLIRWIRTLNVGQILLAGPIFSRASETLTAAESSEDVDPSSPIHVFTDRGALEKYLKIEKAEGYHILVKGSRVMELEKVLPHL